MPHPQDPRQDKPRTMRPGDEAPRGTPGTGEALCHACGGSGKLEGQPCPECGGTGIIIQGVGGA